MQEWVVECCVRKDRWVEVVRKYSKVEAEQVAELMRLGEPKPGSVRVTLKEVALGPFIPFEESSSDSPLHS